MKDFVFDEMQMAKNMISKHSINENNVYDYIKMLTKYNYYVNNMSDQDNYADVVAYIKRHWDMFEEQTYEKNIENSIKYAKKRSFKAIDDIAIYRSELDFIQSIGDIRLEKIAFVLLCVAKYDHYYSDSSDYWVNRSISSTFKLARVHVTAKEQPKLFRELYLTGAFVTSNRVGDVNQRLLFVSDGVDDEIVLALNENDYKELAYLYLFYKNGFDGYVHCEKCGRLTKKRSNNQKLCRECAKIVHRKQKTDSERRRRGVDIQDDF